MLIVVLIPVVFIVGAAAASLVFVRRSTLHITTEGVEVRNYPQPAVLIPLAQVSRFEATPRVGNFKTLRPPTAVLICTDGKRVPTRTLTAPDAGYGVEALNARVNALRGS